MGGSNVSALSACFKACVAVSTRGFQESWLCCEHQCSVLFCPIFTRLMQPACFCFIYCVCMKAGLSLHPRSSDTSQDSVCCSPKQTTFFLSTGFMCNMRYLPFWPLEPLGKSGRYCNPTFGACFVRDAQGKPEFQTPAAEDTSVQLHFLPSPVRSRRSAPRLWAASFF